MPSAVRSFSRSLSTRKGSTAGGKRKSSSSALFGPKILVPFTVAFFVHFLSIFQFHFFKKMKTKMSPEMKQKTRFSEKWPREPFFSILSFFAPFFVFIFGMGFKLR